MSDRELTEHEQVFYNDGYRLGEQAAKVRADEKKFLSYVREMQAAVDELITMIDQHAKTQGVNIACQKGCYYCCHQAVYANSYELHLLSDYMNKKFSKAQKEETLARATKKFENTQKLDDKAVLNYKEPCPVLVDGACGAYPARPMACRIYLSTNLDSCIRFYKDAAKEDSIPQLLEFPLMAGRMMNEGFTAALRQSGIEIAELRLEDGLKTVLTHGVQ